MKTKILVTCVLFILAAAPVLAGSVIINNNVIYDDCVKGNGKSKTETRDLATFESIDLDGAFTVNIVSSSKRQEVKLTGDANILPHVTTSVAGGKLKVSNDKSICPTIYLTIDISVANLKKLEAQGADDVNISGINNDSFSVSLDGTGDIKLSGQTKEMTASISGTGDIKSHDLKAQNADVSVTGVGDVTVHAVNRLKVYINGVSDVIYEGNPKEVIQDINGVGSVEAK